MTVRLAADGTIELDGVCTIEDAQALQQHLLDTPGAVVDWHLCVQAHTAVIQVLLASRTIPRGTPAGEFLKARIDPLLKPLQA
jgi:hypothetical protein